MDVILDANAYISVLHNHGRGFLDTNQFAELLTYLRRTGSRLVIPELVCNEVVARYGERLAAVAKAARDSWSTLQQVSMQQRIDFLEPDIKHELATLGELLHHPAQGVRTVMHTDYSGVDIKQVVRRGIGRVRPANDEGEELRDVILWLIVLHYADQSKTSIAFVSRDKTFQHTDGTLHRTLQRDIERTGVRLAFYHSVGDFVKGNALESEPLEHVTIASYVSEEELRGIATAQLLGSRFWYGTIVGADVTRCEFAEAQRYRVADDSYYIETRYTGEGTIRIAPFATTSVLLSPSPQVDPFPYPTTTIYGAKPVKPVMPGSLFTNEVTFVSEAKGFAGLRPYNELLFRPLAQWVYPASAPKESAYRCNFSIRLSLRVRAGKRESLEVEQFVLLGELVPVTSGSS